MSSLLQLLFVLILAIGPLKAELMHVELAVGGLDCISCAQSVDRILKRIKGVDTASFRTQDAVAVLDLKPGNAVTLPAQPLTAVLSSSRKPESWAKLTSP